MENFFNFLNRIPTEWILIFIKIPLISSFILGVLILIRVHRKNKKIPKKSKLQILEESDIDSLMKRLEKPHWQYTYDDYYQWGVEEVKIVLSKCKDVFQIALLSKVAWECLEYILRSESRAHLNGKTEVWQIIYLDLHKAFNLFIKDVPDTLESLEKMGDLHSLLLGGFGNELFAERLIPKMTKIAEKLFEDLKIAESSLETEKDKIEKYSKLWGLCPSSAPIRFEIADKINELELSSLS
jgi:hypothetical protein